jgi:hypothetical protein
MRVLPQSELEMAASEIYQIHLPGTNNLMGRFSQNKDLRLSCDILNGLSHSNTH